MFCFVNQFQSILSRLCITFPALFHRPEDLLAYFDSLLIGLPLRKNGLVSRSFVPARALDCTGDRHGEGKSVSGSIRDEL